MYNVMQTKSNVGYIGISADAVALPRRGRK